MVRQRQLLQHCRKLTAAVCACSCVPLAYCSSPSARENSPACQARVRLHLRMFQSGNLAGWSEPSEIEKGLAAQLAACSCRRREPLQHHKKIKVRSNAEHHRTKPCMIEMHLLLTTARTRHAKWTDNPRAVSGLTCASTHKVRGIRSLVQRMTRVHLRIGSI